MCKMCVCVLGVGGVGDVMPCDGQLSRRVHIPVLLSVPGIGFGSITED